MKTRNILLAFPLLLSFAFIFSSPQKVQAAQCGSTSNFTSQYYQKNPTSLLGNLPTQVTYDNGVQAENGPAGGAGPGEYGIHTNKYIGCNLVNGTTTVKLVTGAGDFVVGTSPQYGTMTYSFSSYYDWLGEYDYSIEPVGAPSCPSGTTMDTGAAFSRLCFAEGDIQHVHPVYPLCGGKECSYNPYQGGEWAINERPPDVDTGGRSAGANLPVYFLPSIPALQDRKVQEAMIDKINQRGTVELLLESPAGALVYSIPATNCPRIAGPDPEAYAASHGNRRPRKLVFMGGNSLDLSPLQFATLVNDLVKNSIAKTDPFKTYLNHISIYVDLKQVDESRFATEGTDSHKMFDSAYPIVQSSRCTDEPRAVFVLLTSDLKYYAANTSVSLGPLGSNDFGRLSTLVHLDMKGVPAYVSDSADAIPATLMHEFGHAFGGLEDEYVIKETGHTNDFFSTPESRSGFNCVLLPVFAYRSNVDNKWYGSLRSEETAGCSYSTSPNDRDYYRPSPESLMNSNSPMKYNVIDCGFILADILLDSNVAQAGAQRYWPKNTGITLDGQPLIGCMGLDTIKDGIPSTSPSPSISPPASASLSQFLASPFEALRSLLEKGFINQ